MLIQRAALALGLAILAAPLPAAACAVRSPWNPADVTKAEFVVIGRLTDYGVVPLRRDPSEKGWSGGHAEFNLTVEQALVGQPPRRIRVRWTNSTFATPKEMRDGRYLVALYRVEGDGDPSLPDFVVFQRPCSGAFLLKSGSSGALAVLRVLEGLPPSPPDPPPPPAAPSAEPAPAPTWPAVAGSWPAAEGPAETRVPVVVWIVIGLVGASLAAALGALVLGHRPRDENAPSEDEPAA